MSITSWATQLKRNFITLDSAWSSIIKAFRKRMCFALHHVVFIWFSILVFILSSMQAEIITTIKEHSWTLISTVKLLKRISSIL